MEINTIVFGDCRNLSNQIPDESIDLVLTDPPFGINFKYSNGYKDDPEDYKELLQWTIDESNRVIKPGGLIFIYVAQLRLRHILPMFPEDSRIFAACKNFVQIRPIFVQFAYDPVVFWRKDGDNLKNNQGRDWHIGNTANTMNRGINNVDFHSCPRPLDTIIYMVDNFLPVGGIVVDWFMGSGTTAIACKMTGRNYWGCELDYDTARQAQERTNKCQPSFFSYVSNGYEQLEIIEDK